MEFKIWDTVRLALPSLNRFYSNLGKNGQLIYDIYNGVKVGGIAWNELYFKKHEVWFNKDDFEKCEDGFDVFKLTRDIMYWRVEEKFLPYANENQNITIKVWDKVRLTRDALALSYTDDCVKYYWLLIEWFEVHHISRCWNFIYMDERTRWTKEQLELVQEKRIPWLFILFIISLLWNLILAIK